MYLTPIEVVFYIYLTSKKIPELYLTPIEVVPLGSTPAVPTQDRVNTCTHSVSKECPKIKVWRMTQLQSNLFTSILIPHYLQGFGCVWMARSRTKTRFISCITLPGIRWEVCPAAAFAQNTPSFLRLRILRFVLSVDRHRIMRVCQPCDDFCLCRGWRLPHSSWAQQGDADDKLGYLQHKYSKFLPCTQSTYI